MRSAVRLADDLLAVDVGNSKVLAVLLCAGRERGRWRLDYGALSPGRLVAAWDAALGAAVELGAAAPRFPVLLASVVPARTSLVLEGLRRAGLRAVHVAGWRDDWPFALGMDEQHTVGADRLANVAGLVALGQRRAVAIDAGTAVTFDVLRDGCFAGGVITPGFELAARALHDYTAQLPRVAVRGPTALLGRDTRAALRAGIYHGTLQAASGLARALCRELGPGAHVVTTGGQGAEVCRACPAGLATHEPDLSLLGLRLLAARRRSAAGTLRNT